ncbi:MAG: hypothetical protein AAF192_07910, partial [Pseudomonadota bacterium]
MIYSREHGYLFVEARSTASTAIAKELVENHGGVAICHKHAEVHEAVQELGADEVARLFKFITVRNPLDIWVTRYYHLVRNFEGNYTNPAVLQVNGGWLTDYEQRSYDFVMETDATFSEFAQAFPHSLSYWLPHLEGCDHRLRYESLDADFAETLRRIGRAPARPIPAANVSRDKRPWPDYYDGPAQAVARRSKAKEMAALGYAFPDGWVGARPRTASGLLLRLDTALRERAPALKKAPRPSATEKGARLVAEARARAAARDAQGADAPAASTQGGA